jgi:hypothetical protein
MVGPLMPAAVLPDADGTNTMQNLIELIDTRATDVLFNVSIVVLAYVIARMASARGSVALAFAFAPLLLFWAFDNTGTRDMLVRFM